jgi:hypothetical protein
MNLQPDVMGAALNGERGGLRYRYWLDRVWGKDKRMCVFVLLNPSTADALEDDPTTRRCQGYARAWGYGSVSIVNLFALRATKPAALYGQGNPVGALNDDHILDRANSANLIVCAWGVHGAYLGRGEAVRRLLSEYPLHVLGLTKDGHPKHPLNLPLGLQPQLWVPEQAEVA